jgi:hypothetical protein
MHNDVHRGFKIFPVKLQIVASVLLLALSGFLSSPVWADDPHVEIVLDDKTATEPITVRLDSIYAGQHATGDYRVINRTGRSIALESAVSCSCIQADLSPNGLRDGETSSFKIKIDTTNQRGRANNNVPGRVVLKDGSKVLKVIDLQLATKEAVTFPEGKMAWRVGSGEDVTQQSLELHNALTVPVQVTWTAGSPASALRFKVVPAVISIPALGSQKVDVVFDNRVPEAGPLDNLLTLDLQAPGKDNESLSPWKLIVVMAVVPDVPLVAEPGAIICTTSDSKNGHVVRKIKLLKTLNSKAVLDSPVVDDERIKIEALGDNQYSVDIPTSNDQDFLGEIKVQYHIGTQALEIKVPVLVWRK